MDSKPRRHYYIFAHRLLPAIGLSRPDQTMMALTPSHCSEFLEFAWNDVASRIEEEEKCKFPELICTSACFGSFFIPIIAFPEPQGITEAYFCAFVFGPIPMVASGAPNTLPARYFVLEKTYSENPSKPRTVFGEWTKDGKHLNGGDGPEPREEAFLASICVRTGISPNNP
jgi:hypothetical protein